MSSHGKMIKSLILIIKVLISINDPNLCFFDSKIFCVKKITLFRLGNIFIMPAIRAYSECVLILEIHSDLGFKILLT